MYECVASHHIKYPLPCCKQILSHFARPLPLERDVIFERPLSILIIILRRTWSATLRWFFLEKLAIKDYNRELNSTQRSEVGQRNKRRVWRCFSKMRLYTVLVFFGVETRPWKHILFTLCNRLVKFTPRWFINLIFVSTGTSWHLTSLYLVWQLL